MKVIATTYRVQARPNRRSRWTITYYRLESLATAKAWAKFLVQTLDWQILKHQEVVQVVARSPKKQRPKPVRQRKAKGCTQWPHCACIVKGTIQDCVLTDGPLRKH